MDAQDSNHSLDADLALAEMASQGQSGYLGPRGGTTRARPPKMRYSHQAMVDLILEDPTLQQNQIAAYFGRTPAWISTIFTSDAFKARLEARRAEIVDPDLRLSLRERFEALATQSLKVLQEKICRPADQVPDSLALRGAEIGMKALGLGVMAPQVILTSEERLASLAHRLIALQGGRQPDHNVVDI